MRFLKHVNCRFLIENKIVLSKKLTDSKHWNQEEKSALDQKENFVSSQKRTEQITAYFKVNIYILQTKSEIIRTTREHLKYFNV